MYKYGNRLTSGLTGVGSYAAFFTTFLAEGLRLCFLGDAGLEDFVGRPPFHAAILTPVVAQDRPDLHALFFRRRAARGYSGSGPRSPASLLEQSRTQTWPLKQSSTDWM